MNNNEDGEQTGSKEEVEQVSQALSHEEIIYLSEFFQLKTIFCLISKKKLQSLDPHLQTYTNLATIELLNGTGIVHEHVPDEVFLFRNENCFIRGCRLLKKRVKKFEHTEFSSICAKPSMLFEKVTEISPRIVHYDLGSKGSKRFGRNRIPAIVYMCSLVPIARLTGLFVLNDDLKRAVTMEMEDGKPYVLTFLNEEDGAVMIDGAKSNGDNYVIKFNFIKKLIAQVLNSSFSGLVINPASSTQTVLSRDDIVLVKTIFDVLQPPSIFSANFWRKTLNLK